MSFPAIRLGIPAAFFVSGATALLYQIISLRNLALVFGNSTYATAVVVSVFMGGMALGSILGGWAADRTTRPLRLYGLVELGIGISAWCVPHATQALKPLLARVYTHPNVGQFELTAIRAGIATAVLIAPTTLIGATLPVVSKLSIDTAERLGPRVGLLYGLNTLGAAVGCCMTGLFLIRTIGMSNTLSLGCAVNTLLGLSILMGEAMFGRLGSGDPNVRTCRPPHRDGKTGEIRARRAVHLVLFLSGLASLSYEVLWVRLLDFVLFRGSSVFSFTLVLSTFLIGTTVGSTLYATTARRFVNSLRALALLNLTIGIAAPMCMSLLGRYRASTWGSRGWHDLTVVMVLTFFPTILMGIAFPLACDLASGASVAIGRSIGQAYGANTLGCVAGPLVTAFLVIPVAGTNGAFVTASAVNFIACSILLAADGPSKRSVLVRVGSTALALSVLLLESRLDLTEALIAPVRKRVVFFREDPATTVLAFAERNGIALNVGGVLGAGTIPQFAGSQKLLAYVPLLLHPHPKRIVVVGFGVGRTARFYADNPLVDHVDIVEISDSVLEAGRTLFAEVNHRVLSSSKVSVIVDDGFNYIKYSPGTYDVISVDMWSPRIAGSYALYTREFWDNCLSKLGDNGLFITWTLTTVTDERVFKILLGTFQSVFEHAAVLFVPPEYVLFLGARSSLRIDDEQVNGRLRDQSMLVGADEPLISNESDLLQYFVAGEDQIRRFVGKDQELNTLNRPTLQLLRADTVPRRAVDAVRRLRAEPRSRSWDPISAAPNHTARPVIPTAPENAAP